MCRLAHCAAVLRRSLAARSSLRIKPDFSVVGLEGSRAVRRCSAGRAQSTWAKLHTAVAALRRPPLMERSRRPEANPATSRCLDGDSSVNRCTLRFLRSGDHRQRAARYATTPILLRRAVSAVAPARFAEANPVGPNECTSVGFVMPDWRRARGKSCLLAPMQDSTGIARFSSTRGEAFSERSPPNPSDWRLVDAWFDASFDNWSPGA